MLMRDVGRPVGVRFAPIQDMGGCLRNSQAAVYSSAYGYGSRAIRLSEMVVS
jgi:hypothetical protein